MSQVKVARERNILANWVEGGLWGGLEGWERLGNRSKGGC